MTCECNCDNWDKSDPSLHRLDCTVYRSWLSRGAYAAKTPPAFTVGQECRTRDGRRARVVCVDRKSKWPVVALVELPDGGEELCSYSERGWKVQPLRPGGVHHENPSDLLPAPRRAVVWVGMFAGHYPDVSPLIGTYSKDMLDKARADGVKALVRVELEEGRFDD